MFVQVNYIKVKVNYIKVNLKSIASNVVHAMMQRRKFCKQTKGYFSALRMHIASKTDKKNMKNKSLGIIYLSIS